MKRVRSTQILLQKRAHAEPIPEEFHEWLVLRLSGDNEFTGGQLQVCILVLDFLPCIHDHLERLFRSIEDPVRLR